MYNKADSKFIHICPKANMLVGYDQMSDAENEEEIERAIDEIIQYDFTNIYKKVRKSDTKSV